MEEGKELAIELGNAENLRKYEEEADQYCLIKDQIYLPGRRYRYKSIKFTSGLFYF